MKKESGRIIFWFVIGLAIIGSFLAIMFANPGGSSEEGGTVPAVSDREWIRGNSDASVTLVEYSDFQCPACASREPLVKDIVKEFGEHIKFVYRHFPLKSIHRNAQLAAQAAEAAGLQGKFWEMHDLIFENQKNWESQSGSAAEGSFAAYAQQLGLDTGKFKDDLNSGAVEGAVDDDFASGREAKVNSTPTFFLNGSKINPRTYDEFRELVRKAIEAAA